MKAYVRFLSEISFFFQEWLFFCKRFDNIEIKRSSVYWTEKEVNKVERQKEITLKMGLQARQAALFVQEANRHGADIFLQKDEKKVNAKSIMGIMSLAIAKGSVVTLIADGDDAEKAVNALANLIGAE